MKIKNIYIVVFLMLFINSSFSGVAAGVDGVSKKSKRKVIQKKEQETVPAGSNLNSSGASVSEKKKQTLLLQGKKLVQSQSALKTFEYVIADFENKRAKGHYKNIESLQAWDKPTIYEFGLEKKQGYNIAHVYAMSSAISSAKDDNVNLIKQIEIMEAFQAEKRQEKGGKRKEKVNSDETDGADVAISDELVGMMDSAIMCSWFEKYPGFKVDQLVERCISETTETTEVALKDKKERYMPIELALMSDSYPQAWTLIQVMRLFSQDNSQNKKLENQSAKLKAVMGSLAVMRMIINHMHRICEDIDDKKHPKKGLDDNEVDVVFSLFKGAYDAYNYHQKSKELAINLQFTNLLFKKSLIENKTYWKFLKKIVPFLIQHSPHAFLQGILEQGNLESLILNNKLCPEHKLLALHWIHNASTLSEDTFKLFDEEYGSLANTYSVVLDKKQQELYQYLEELSEQHRTRQGKKGNRSAEVWFRLANLIMLNNVIISSDSYSDAGLYESKLLTFEAYDFLFWQLATIKLYYPNAGIYNKGGMLICNLLEDGLVASKKYNRFLNDIMQFIGRYSPKATLQFAGKKAKGPGQKVAVPIINLSELSPQQQASVMKSINLAIRNAGSDSSCSEKDKEEIRALQDLDLFKMIKKRMGSIEAKSTDETDGVGNESDQANDILKAHIKEYIEECDQDAAINNKALEKAEKRLDELYSQKTKDHLLRKFSQPRKKNTKEKPVKTIDLKVSRVESSKVVAEVVAEVEDSRVQFSGVENSGVEFTEVESSDGGADEVDGSSEPTSTFCSSLFSRLWKPFARTY